ncbi:MAG: hypothetical protein M1834_003861 [Cirrosporium novae-zelandiae]|nr:MAG: hypothetical protein M1834_003861 [Cirrosporium novae-zelandiae]
MSSSIPTAPFGSAENTEELGQQVAEAIRNMHDNEKEDGKDADQISSTAHSHSRDTSSTSSATAGKENYDVISREGEARVAHLARQMSMLSRKSTDYGAQGSPNPFTDASSDPELDPLSPEFRPQKWMKALLHIYSRDPERYPQRTAGVSFSNLNVYGYGSAVDYQDDVGNVWAKGLNMAKSLIGSGEKRRIDILRNFEGLVKSGEMLVVLGRPGSGCSTFLKTIAGETHGLYLDEGHNIQYQGISAQQMHSNFRGEVVYQAETEQHFPQLTVGETLMFAAKARAPRNRIPGITRNQYAEVRRDVVMATFGLSHTVNTKIGNDLIRGVSGGERKRVSIAEVALTGSPLQCWDNSTRGLDSATALEFVKSLRLSTQYSGSTAVVSIYQAGQAIYDLFDKVVVLYEGREIYFGPIQEARGFFVDMGFECPDRQTTADFLTSLTSPVERRVRPGWEDKVPRTPDEFVARWTASADRKALLQDIEAYEREFPLGGQQLQLFTESRAAEKAKRTRMESPYTLSYPMQIRLCIERGFQRLHGNMGMTLATVIGNNIMALVIASVFYNLSDDTSSLYSRGALLFFAILMNAFSSALEILTLYEQRPIVEKHAKYALYHPSAEALSSMIVDMPAKIIVAIIFNVIIYFMPNLRRTAGHFFIFLLFSFATTLTMSNIFRTIGAASRSLSQAMVPSAIFILALVTYTGFSIPTRDMHPWFRWINYVDPIGYGFEALMINEFHDREIPCSVYIPTGPGYEDITNANRICTVTGAKAGLSMVSGDDYINTGFEYYANHLWRNFGIIIGFFVFFLITYLMASEYITAKPSKGEILVFQKGRIPAFMKKNKGTDIEGGEMDEKVQSDNGSDTPNLQKQTAIFQWKDVCYDIKIKGQTRRILDHVDGWVKPGTLTALMGVSGAGKTTLLDVLADRVTMGIVTGEMMVDGRLRDASFQRKTGYVQQQDLHLETSTVREALIFSAELRQPPSIPREEKIAYVEEVIKMLGMEEYAEAVVGILGEGLNVDQRKRLTIGVEIAAKPDLLLFFDEPTSGLDSQTAWSICSLMRKLADHGQAILCTIHQPSAMLMQQFDRLLFLAKGGRTVYFGDLGNNMETLIKYFEKNCTERCPSTANPAEWMLEVIGAAPGSHTDHDWPEVWKASPERAAVREELDQMKAELSQHPIRESEAGYGEFAMPLWYQYLVIQKRVFQQYWRSPTYIYAKFALCFVPPLFIGFSFYNSPRSIQGLQNQMFSIFMLLTILPQLVQQSMPYFVTQRALYEARERPSKAYSWKAFMISSIIVEIPWNTLMSVFVFVTWYYPIGLQKNAEFTDSVASRGGLMFLLIWQFLMFTTTLSSMVIAGMEKAETGGNIASLMFSMTLIFCGVLATPDALPRFWIFMYRVSPFTYLVSAVLSTGLANAPIECSSIEFLTIQPPSGQTCQQYLSDYLSFAGGKLTNGNATSDCQLCSMATTNAYLSEVDISFDDRYRNVGILFAYIIFNFGGALFFYWLARVPKHELKKAEKENKQA